MGNKEYSDYHGKKKHYRKDGTIHAGKGKKRPHHKAAQKNVKRTNNPDTNRHRAQIAENSYIPRTPNKYQSGPKKVYEDATSVSYEWLEDNGHKDHCQLRRKKVMKDEDRMPTIVGGATVSREYKENYEKIFGKKKRGVEVGHKKFKKTY